MDPEKRAFLAAIEADRYDWTTRKVFADWLEEHGEDDEAAIHRRWTPEKESEAEEYLSRFADECEMDYETLLEQAKNEGGLYLGSDTPDIAYDLTDFWRHYEVVTDSVVPDAKRESFHVSCAC